ncbi:MAG: hypothetical protein J7497_04625 [Chitinophagaceae bacterium]|nr:hypothetical protein [Chitinophagaceae bacterium]
MTNKSSKSPSGEERESKTTFIREEQPNLQNRGLQEDHPNNPVRTTGSTRKDQETLPTGEPDPGEA